MKRFISVLLVIALLVPMLCVDVFAADKTVSDFAGLKDAIAQAQDDDVITVNGDITITQTLMITKNITIKSDGTKTLTAGPLKMDSIEGCNMFYVPDGKTLSLENITLDGDNKCRLIRAKGAKLNLTNVIMKNGSTEFLQQTPSNDQVYSGGAIYAEEGSIVTIKGGSFENNNTGTRALDGSRAAEGGAIKLYKSELYINDETTTVKDTTKFTGNHLDGWETTGGRQGGSIEATESKVEIYGTTFDIVGPFNTGGAIKFEDCGTETEKVKVINSSFTIVDGKKPVGMAGGAITSEGSHLLIDNSTFKTGKGSYVQESGGLIQVVGIGTFDLKNSELNGSGVGWNETGANKTAKYGGAIVFYDDSTVKATIENTTIQNFTAEISGGAIALNTQIGKNGGTELTLIDTKLLNNLAYAFDMTAYGGGIFVGKGNTVTMEGGQISSNQYSSVGGAIYNEGKVTLTKSEKGNAQIINNKAYHMAGGVLNDGELIVDYATFSGNVKGDWSNTNQHVLNKNEMAGENIYAAKDVTITPNAQFDGKDVRIIEGRSSILLTGKLPEGRYINVSISESEKTTGKDLFQEKSKRKVGYLVAKGTEGYTPTDEDAQKIHYVSKDTDPAQPRADFADHTSPGKWDFVLNPETKQVVLGQRVKLIYHGNLGKLGENDSAEKTVDVYKNPNFWEGQLEEYQVGDPELEGSSFMAWYFWKDGTTAGDEDDSIQNIKIPNDFTKDLFDFSKVTFQNNIKDTDKIITPNVIHTYAGWSQNISIPVLKDWVDAEEADKVDVTVTLKGGDEDVTLTLTKAKNYVDQFDDLKVFTKSYQPNEEKNMNLKFTPKTYSVVETPIDGFATSYSPQSMIANQVAEVSRFVVTNSKTGNVYVKYIAEDGTVLEAESKVVENAAVGTDYTTTQKTFDNYEFSKMGEGSAAASGKVVAGDLHVVYVYKTKTGNVYVKYIAEDGTELEAESAVKKNAPVGEAYTTEQKTFDGYEFSKMADGSAAASGKVIAGNLHVLYVYKKIEKESDFTIKKSVDKTYYKKAGEVLTYTITVTNTGEKDLTKLKLTDQLVNVKDEPFNLDKGASKTFSYSYTITEDDVKATSVTNVASVTDGKTTRTDDAKSILKEKEKRGDVYVRYETEDGKILDEFAVLIDAPVGTYYYTEEKAFPRYRFVGLAPYSDPAEGYVVEGTQYVVYLYRRDRGGRTPDRRDRYEREEKEVEEPIVEAKRKPELNKKDHKQYMYGYPDWTFVPAANITRGEAAAMFARLFKEYPGLDYNYKKYYTDVDESYWGFKEVAYLSEFGILSGYSDGTFRPNNKITRAEFVKIAESFEALTWGLSPYNDVDGGHWAFRYIVSSAAKGWISGYPDGTFRPNSFISRAEAVTIVNRLLERRPDKDYINTHKPELKPFTDLKPSYWAYYEIYEAVDGHDYNRSFTDIEEHWYRLNNERFVFSQPRYYR